MAFPAASPLLCILHAFPHFLSLPTCYMASLEWKQENKRARLHSVQLPWSVGGQNCKHFSTNGTIPPPSPQPCSCPPCPHYPSLRGSLQRPLALGSEKLNLFKHPDTSSVHQWINFKHANHTNPEFTGEEVRRVPSGLGNIFPFGKGRGGGRSLHSSLELAAGHSGSSQRKFSSEAQLDIHWFLNRNLKSDCPSNPRDWGLSK